ncbi:hypothetical protein B1T50_10435, partial [Mycobacterium kansasii]
MATLSQVRTGSTQHLIEAAGYWTKTADQWEDVFLQLSDSDSVKFDMALLPAGATVERLGTGTLVLLGQDPADPPLRDVLQVRRAMGYEVPTQRTESSEDVDAASAGPTATPTAPGASVNPTDRGQSDPRPGIETRGVGYPESNT